MPRIPLHVYLVLLGIAIQGLVFLSSVAANRAGHQDLFFDEPVNPFQRYTLSKYKSKDELLKVGKEKVKSLIYHGINSYLKYAYPKDELLPLSCTGKDTLGSYALTLIDSLDSYAVLGDYEGFKNAIELVRNVTLIRDITVSVFETNIRIVGGLLSAHIIAKRKLSRDEYDGFLLDKAEEVGNSLLPAFDTPTGMPFGSINLMKGVNPGETPEVCCACAGTYSLEFTWLGKLTKRKDFQKIARRSTRKAWKLRLNTDLLGDHIDSSNGRWTWDMASVGGSSDSFYEYVGKAFYAFSDEKQYGEMWNVFYAAIMKHLRKGNWFMNARAADGQSFGAVHVSLASFFPGMMTLMGDVNEAVLVLQNLIQVVRKHVFLAEATDIGASEYNPLHGKAMYIGRPELIESMYYVYRATKDVSILEWALEFADRFEQIMKKPCGFAMIKDVDTLELEDKMESFFIAETLKYLYLIFDEANEFNGVGWVFNTEAHPLPTHISYKPRNRGSERKGYYKTRKSGTNVDNSTIYEDFKAGVCSMREYLKSLKTSHSLGPITYWRDIVDDMQSKREQMNEPVDI